jgi:hypothetical protein
MTGTDYCEGPEFVCFQENSVYLIGITIVSVHAHNTIVHRQSLVQFLPLNRTRQPERDNEREITTNPFSTCQGPSQS